MKNYELYEELLEYAYEVWADEEMTDREFEMTQNLMECDMSESGIEEAIENVKNYFNWLWESFQENLLWIEARPELPF